MPGLCSGRLGWSAWCNRVPQCTAFRLAAAKTVIYYGRVLDKKPLTFAPQVASIAADLRATADFHAAQAGLVAALHALILAALARLFTRLEDLVTLWQSGQFSAPASHIREPQSRPGGPMARMNGPTAGQGGSRGGYCDVATKADAIGSAPHLAAGNDPVDPASRASLQMIARAQRPARAIFPRNAWLTTLPPRHPRACPWPRAGPTAAHREKAPLNSGRLTAPNLLLNRNKFHRAPTHPALNGYTSSTGTCR